MKKYILFYLLIILILGLLGCENNKVINYTLGISVVGEGSVTPEPGEHQYKKDTLVTLTVTPTTGNNFSGWDGPDGDMINEENKLLMTKDMEVTAVFSPWDIVADPQFSVNEGTYTGVQLVEMSCATTDAEIRYTTDGSEPSATNGTIYNNAISVNHDVLLKAIAIKEGMTDSSVVTANYVINYTLETAVDPSYGGNIAVNPDQANYKYGDTVSLEAIASSGYSFRNWTGDLSGTDNPGSITIDGNKSVTAEFTSWDVVTAPQFSVDGGTYNGAQSVDISCATIGAEIRYTTDGTDPLSHGILYSDSITINDDTTLKAIAIKAGMINSSIITAEYVINYSLTTTVNPSGTGSITADPDKVNYKYGDSVSLTATASSGYDFSNWSGDLSGTGNPSSLTIDDNKSVTADFTPWDTVAVPQFSLAGGTYTGAQQVEISCATEGAIIYYTTDGSEPSQDNGTVYTVSITIDDNTTLKAIALKDGMTGSSVITADYVINYTLNTTVTPQGTGSITVTPEQESYKYNDVVTLEAVPTSEYNFSNWSGDLTSSTNPETLIINNNKSVTAEFALKEYNFIFTVSDEAANPLNGATVTVGEQTQTTDATGETTFSLAAGTYSYSISSGDYETESGNIDVSSENTSKEVVLLYYASTTTELSTAFADNTVVVINLDSSEYDLSDSVCAVNGVKILKSTDPSLVYLNIDQDYGNITAQNPVTMKHLIEGGFTSNTNKTLGLDTIINGDLIITAGTLDINSQSITIYGSILQRGGTLNANEGAVNVDLNYIIEEEDGSRANAILQMTTVSDYITVGGNFVMNSSWSHSDKLTDGTLEIKGDFTEKYNYQSRSTYTNFQATGNHKVILSGSGTQSVMIEAASSGSSCFANLELDNTGTLEFVSRAAVTGNIINKMITAPTGIINLYPAGTATINSGLSNEGEWPWDLGIYENWTLVQNISIGGDYYLLGNCTVNPDGYTMNIGGSFYQRSGTFTVNGSVVNISGDYIIEKADGNNANSILQMTTASDYITVGGNFVMNSSWSHSDKLTDGTLEIKGNFTEKYNYQSRSTWTNFQATGNHKVILSGNGTQSVMFETASSGSSCFANLELDNTGTLEFASRAAVTGNIINKMSTAPTGIINLYPAGTATINSGLSNKGEWPWDMGIYENWTLQHDLTIAGDLHIFRGTLYENGYELNVNGNIINH